MYHFLLKKPLKIDKKVLQTPYFLGFLFYTQDSLDKNNEDFDFSYLRYCEDICTRFEKYSSKLDMFSLVCSYL